MILRWRPDNGRDWNLGTISKHGVVWMDYLGQQANSAGLPELHKQYLAKLADLVPGAYIRKTPKETAWYVAQTANALQRMLWWRMKCARMDGFARSQTSSQR